MVICAFESTAEFHSLKPDSVEELWMGYNNADRHQLTLLYSILLKEKKRKDVLKHLLANNHIYVFH